jgi:hypothetical protein
MEEGATASMKVRITNTSPQAWPDSTRLSLSVLPSVPWYDGSGRTGTQIARVPVPALKPGETADVTVPFTAPVYAGFAAKDGRGLFHVDIVIGSTRLSKAGVVALQMPFTLTEAPNPEPTPSPTPEPTPTPDSSVEPSEEPSPAP